MDARNFPPRQAAVPGLIPGHLLSMTHSLSRRTVLRGLGTMLALPWLESMGTVTSWVAGAAPGKTAPNRMAFVYVPNGKDMANWTPKTEGAAYELPDTM